MPNIIEIADIEAPELAPYCRLTEAQLRSRQRPERALFIAESPKVILHALDAGYEPVSLLTERRHITGSAAEIISRRPLLPVYTGDSSVLEKLTGYELTRGVLCAMRRPELPTLSAVCKTARRVAVLENIVDPTNVGSIFRAAAALGMDGVLLTPSCCDPLHRRAVRVSMGAVFQIPWTYIGQNAPDWRDNGPELLRAQGFRSVAMALTQDSVSIENPRLSALERLAIVLGTEGDGLAAKTVASCDYTARIPMANGVDSLNVAAAAAIAFWQLREK